MTLTLSVTNSNFFVCVDAKLLSWKLLALRDQHAIADRTDSHSGHWARNLIDQEDPLWVRLYCSNNDHNTYIG